MLIIGCKKKKKRKEIYRSDIKLMSQHTCSRGISLYFKEHLRLKSPLWRLLITVNIMTFNQVIVDSSVSVCTNPLCVIITTDAGVWTPRNVWFTATASTEVKTHDTCCVCIAFWSIEATLEAEKLSVIVQNLVQKKEKKKKKSHRNLMFIRPIQIKCTIACC